jgi:ribonucleoside-diphosphate reductase alpha chain
LVKDTEWNTVADYLYENRHDFTAVSLLADNGDKVYQQAPFEAMISDEDLAKFNKLKEAFKAVDYTKMFEEDDDTTLQQEMSCVGGVCMV